MEALLVSPLRPWEIIVGKVAPYLAIGFVSVRRRASSRRGWCFDVPLRGSVAAPAVRGRALHPRVALARHPDLGAHLVAARRDDGRAARHDAAEHAAVGLHLSGREHAGALRAISNVVPGRWFVAIARGIMLEGHRARTTSGARRSFSRRWRPCCWSPSVRSFNERLE